MREGDGAREGLPSGYWKGSIFSKGLSAHQIYPPCLWESHISPPENTPTPPQAQSLHPIGGTHARTGLRALGEGLSEQGSPLR